MNTPDFTEAAETHVNQLREVQQRIHPNRILPYEHQAHSSYKAGAEYGWNEARRFKEERIAELEDLVKRAYLFVDMSDLASDEFKEVFRKALNPKQ